MDGPDMVVRLERVNKTFPIASATVSDRSMHGRASGSVRAKNAAFIIA
jgi:hypothetical protein